MIITKPITIAIDIHDPINFSINPELNLKNILNDRYKGICYAGCYILQVLDIKKYSDCYINRNGPPSFGTVNVSFTVQALVYVPGEIITGCSIISNESMKAQNGLVKCIGTYVSASFKYEQAFAGISTGQLVSIRVGIAKYNIGASKIVVAGSLLLPNSFNNNPYYALAPFNSFDIKYIEPILENIRALENEISKLDKSFWKLFEDLIYSRKSRQFPKLGDTISSGKVEDLVQTFRELATKGTKDTIYMIRDPELNLANGVFCCSDKPPNDIDKENIIKNVEPKEIALILLNDYYNVARASKEMTEIYGSKEMIDKHKALWAIYTKSKTA